MSKTKGAKDVKPRTRRTTGPVEDRFWSKVAKGAPSECWPWQGARSRFGHGVFRVVGGNERAHRIAYLLTHGQLPMDGQLVRHTCDNPPCCNPAHLVPGTHLDNTRDKMERGRWKGGRKKGGAKFTKPRDASVSAERHRVRMREYMRVKRTVRRTTV